MWPILDYSSDSFPSASPFSLVEPKVPSNLESA